jgi:TetR/AcrR family transcriptional regulator, regulator of biofilm formation and stress response
MATKPAIKRPPRGDGRVALLEAAIRVGAHQGLRGLTIRSAAAEAGVSHGLVRHHFGSRQQLVDEALEYAARKSMITGDLEPGTGDPADFSRALEDIVADDPDLQAFQYEMAMDARRRPELLATNHAIYEQYRQMGLADDPALAHAVFAMLDGLVLQKVLFGKPVEPALEWLRTMLKALQATEAAPAKRGSRRRRVESADAVEG